MVDVHISLYYIIFDYKFFLSKENDDIRVQQMQEMAYLQSLEHSDAIPPMHPQMAPIAMTPVPVTVQPVIRGRTRPVLRGTPVGIARGIRGGRTGQPMAGECLFLYAQTMLNRL